MSQADKPDADKGFGTHANELIGLIVAYAKQETIVPIKRLGRYIAFGLIGAVLLTTGAVLLTITALRAIQTEAGRHLGGELTWIPYLGAAIVPLLLVAWAGFRITKGDKAVGGQR